MNLKSYSSSALVDALRLRVQTERKITAEIIEFIREIDERRVYLEYGVTSLFAFLTDVIGYSSSAAQRRILAARFIRAVPQLHDDLKSGEINLTHVSLLAQGIRQKEKESSTTVTNHQKRELVEKLKFQRTEKAQVIVSQELDLKIRQHDVSRKQKDDSLRVEMTLSKDEQAEIERAKSLLSHALPGANLSELFLFLVRDFLKRKDPLQAKATAGAAVTKRQKDKVLHQRDQTCRWRDPQTGRVCGSTFQNQKDHIIPKWAGGTDEPGNLQLLCAAHNRLKYRKQANLKFLSDQRLGYEVMSKSLRLTGG